MQSFKHKTIKNIRIKRKLFLEKIMYVFTVKKSRVNFVEYQIQENWEKSELFEEQVSNKVDLKLACHVILNFSIAKESIIAVTFGWVLIFKLQFCMQNKLRFYSNRYMNFHQKLVRKWTTKYLNFFKSIIDSTIHLLDSNLDPISDNVVA